MVGDIVWGNISECILCSVSEKFKKWAQRREKSVTICENLSFSKRHIRLLFLCLKMEAQRENAAVRNMDVWILEGRFYNMEATVCLSLSGQFEVCSDQERFKAIREYKSSIFHHAHSIKVRNTSIKVKNKRTSHVQVTLTEVMTSLQTDAKVEFVTQSLFIESVWSKEISQYVQCGWKSISWCIWSWCELIIWWKRQLIVFSLSDNSKIDFLRCHQYKIL